MSDTQEIQSDSENPASQRTDDAQDTRAEPASSEPTDTAPALAAMIAAIRSAVVPNASPEARAAGVTACRSILTVLEVKPGQPLASPQPGSAQPGPTGAASPVASLLSQPGLLTKLAAMSREQLLDLLKQVTGAAAQRTPSPATGTPRFHLIQVPQVRRPGGG
jgi:hypothetical protein